MIASRPACSSLLLSALLAGCAKTMPVLPAATSTSQFEGAFYSVSVLPLEKALPGVEVYRAFRQAATGFVSHASVRSSVEETTTQFCTRQGKAIRPVQETSSTSGMLPGNFPRIEWLFQCVEVSRSGSEQSADIDRLARLERLKRLLDNGTLTQQEFDAEKAKVLGTPVEPPKK